MSETYLLIFPQKNVPSRKYCCTLANFRIEKKIGRGQFSEVYKATYLLDGQLVALKKVQVQSCSASSFRVKVRAFTYTEHPIQWVNKTER